MKNFFFTLFVTASFSATAQNWENLTFNDAVPGLNVNPVRGLIPGYDGTRNFPYSMEFFYIPLRGTMNNINDFNWTAFENKLEEIANRGNTAVPRFYLDYPGRDIATPQFLIDAGVVMKDYTVYNNDPNESKSPDYNDPRVMAALVNFIENFGVEYDGDPRISVVQGGLVGFWGEWHNYPIGEQMSDANKKIIFEKFISAFPNTKINIRSPQTDVSTSSELKVGYHDDSFLLSTLGPDGWHFWPRIIDAGVSMVWKNHPIGGEIHPDLQDGVWQAIPNNLGQNFETCVNTTHATYMLNHGVFDDPVGSTTYNNALIQNRKFGYKFYANGIKLNAYQNGEINIDVRLENKGVAPFYYNWQVEFGLLKDGVLTSLGTANWNINTVQPNDVVIKNFTTNRTLQAGEYTILMRFINPLTALKPNAKQLSFANSEQNAHLNGWLSLKTFQKGVVQPSWETLTYNPGQPKLELNPLKGFATMFGEGNNFPRSIHGRLFGLDSLMLGPTTFRWNQIDTFLAQQSRKGWHSYLQVNIDFVDGKTRMPDYLVNQVDWYFQPASGNNSADSCPNYNDPELITAMLTFIDSFGARYKNDPRIFMVHLGLYGMWGEWHIGNVGNIRPEFEMTEQNKTLIVNAYENAFSGTYLLARYPEHMPDPQKFGYSDGLFFGQSIHPSNNYYFHNTLKNYKADKNWKLYPIGGEIDPGLQPTIFDILPNPNNGQDVYACLDSIRPTWLFWNHIFQSGVPNNQEWNNGLTIQKAMGYTFYIDKCRIAAANGKPAIEINLQNKGIAPMYGNWNVEFGVLNSSNQFTSLGFKKLNLNLVQPLAADNYRSFFSNTVLPDGTYKFLMKVVNPLEVYSAQANPVRFANTTQDADKEGWITLGQKTISSGSAGVVPTKVTSLSVTPASATLQVGQTLQLVPQILPTNATNPAITYVSSHPATARVDANGLITAGPGYGNVMITAYTQDGGFTAQSIITVEPIRVQLPALIEAENYIKMSGVVVENLPGGGFNLGFIDNNDWMDYGVIVNTPSSFSVDFRVSSPTGGCEISLLSQTGNILGTVSVPSTGSWGNYTTVTLNTATLPAGAYNLRVFASKGGFNINWLEFKNQAILPVRLLDVKATAKNETILVEWTTSSETDNEGFYIERSTNDHTDFTRIAWMNSKGAANGLTHYHLTDSNVVNNRNYFYRLAQVDRDKKLSYSKIVSAKLNGSAGDNNNLISLYPNPTKNWVKINVNNSGLNLRQGDINLFNVLGMNVTPVIPNNSIIDIAHLPNGVYFLVVNIKGEKITKKIIKN